MKSDLLDHTPYRNGLITLLTGEKWRSVCAGHLARYVQAVNAADVVLYGCGKLSEELAADHGAALAGRRVRFCATAKDAATFHGYEKIAVAELAGTRPDLVILASGTYDVAMRAELARVGIADAVSLKDILNLQVGREELEAMVAAVRQGFSGFLERLAALTGNGKPTLFAFIDNFGPFHNLASLGQLRALGWNTAVCVRNPKPSVDLAQAQAACDLLVCHDTPCEAFLLLEAVVATAHPRLVLEYYSTGVPDPFLSLLPQVLETRANKISLLVDAHPSQLYDNVEVQARYQRQVGLPVPEILSLYGHTLNNLDAVIHKDAPEILKRFAGEGFATPVHTHAPLIIDSTRDTQGAARPKPGEPVRIVFGTSIPVGEGADWAYRQDSLYPMIQALTDQGLRFTMYNVADYGQGLYPEIEAAAAANPLFEYRRHVSPHVFTEELKQYHFGWIANDMGDRAGMFSRTNLQLKIFFYAQVGLPILVNPDFDWCDRFVRMHGLGLSVRRADWENVAAMLRDFDHAGYARNVQAFKARHDHRDVCARLAAFYEGLPDARARG